MSTLLLMSLLAGSAPSTVGLLIIDRDAATADRTLQAALHKQVQTLAKDAAVQVRVVRHQQSCNLEEFQTRGIDFKRCGIAMPSNTTKVYVVESNVLKGEVALTAAMFDGADLVFGEKPTYAGR